MAKDYDIPPQLAFYNPTRTNPFGHSTDPDTNKGVSDYKHSGEEQGAIGGDILYAKEISVPQRLPNTLKSPPTEQLVNIDPNTDTRFHEDLRKIGYKVNQKHFNSHPQSPVIGATFYEVREVSVPGFLTDPDIATSLVTEGYNFSPEAVGSTKLLTFSIGSQFSGAQGTIKYLPELGIIASSIESIPLLKIGEAYLAHTYGTGWEKTIGEIMRDIEKEGELRIDKEELVSAITKLTSSPKREQTPAAILTKLGNEPLTFIPPNIVMDHQFKQIHIEGDQGYKKNEAALIKDIINMTIFS